MNLDKEISRNKSPQRDFDFLEDENSELCKMLEKERKLFSGKEEEYREEICNLKCNISSGEKILMEIRKKLEERDSEYFGMCEKREKMTISFYSNYDHQEPPINKSKYNSTMTFGTDSLGESEIQIEMHKTLPIVSPERLIDTKSHSHSNSYKLRLCEKTINTLKESKVKSKLRYEKRVLEFESILRYLEVCVEQYQEDKATPIKAKVYNENKLRDLEIRIQGIVGKNNNLNKWIINIKYLIQRLASRLREQYTREFILYRESIKCCIDSGGGAQFNDALGYIIGETKGLCINIPDTHDKRIRNITHDICQFISNRNIYIDTANTAAKHPHHPLNHISPSDLESAFFIFKLSILY